LLDTFPSLRGVSARRWAVLWSSASWNGTERWWCRTAGRWSRWPTAWGCPARSSTHLDRPLPGRRPVIGGRPDPPPHQLPASDHRGDRGSHLRAAQGASRVGTPRIEHHLAKGGFQPVPSRSSIHRCLKRHRLVELPRRSRRDPEMRARLPITSSVESSLIAPSVSNGVPPCLLGSSQISEVSSDSLEPA